MIERARKALRLLPILSGLVVLLTAALPQERPQPGKPFDVDRLLPGPQDRALSYYYFSLAKWHEDNGDVTRAVSEMQKAVKHNATSSSVRVELARLLANARRSKEAEEEAQEAVRLDPKSPEPHWVLANIYNSTRNRPGDREQMRKAVQELELMSQLDPKDERAYWLLGSIYFELSEPDKAVQSYEKFQAQRKDVNDGYVAIAEYYQRRDNAEKAIEYLNKAIAVQPDSIKALMMLAQTYSRQNKDKEAVPLYRKMLELTGDNRAVRRQLAASLVDTGQFEEALALLEKLTADAPQEKELLTLLGRAQMGSGQIPKAIETFTSALKDNPDNLEAEFYLGTCYEQSGKPDEAAKIFSGLLEKTEGEEQKSNRLVFRQHLASAYQEMGENAKAIALYEEMVKNDAEGNPRLISLLINAYRVDRQFDKAVALGKQQFEKKPNDPAIGIFYARALADAGKVNPAADVLNRLVASNPTNLDLYMNLSQIYLQGKRFTEAEKVLRRAQERQLDDDRIKFQLGAVYERQKDFDRAESLFKEVLKSDPENATALNYIGYMLADRGVRLQEAKEYVEKALALEPNNGAYLDSLGWAFYKLNDLENAEKYLLKAVAIVRNDPTIHDHLGDLYHKTGDYEKAMDYWQKSLLNNPEEEEAERVRDKIERLRETLRKQRRRD